MRRQSIITIPKIKKMKRKFLIAVIGLLGTFAAGAQTDKDMVIQAGSAKNIFLASDLHVVLRPAAATQTTLWVNEEASQNLRIQWSGASMRVEPIGSSVKEATVYLVVTDLQNLTLGQNVLVETQGILNAPHIHVFADADSKAFLKTRGRIKAESLWENEISVKHILAASPAQPAF